MGETDFGAIKLGTERRNVRVEVVFTAVVHCLEPIRERLGASPVQTYPRRDAVTGSA
jgi:hypothetical protein